MIEMYEDLERRLKHERREICLNCQNFLTCERSGKVEPCVVKTLLRWKVKHGG